MQISQGEKNTNVLHKGITLRNSIVLDFVFLILIILSISYSIIHVALIKGGLTLLLKYFYYVIIILAILLPSLIIFIYFKYNSLLKTIIFGLVFNTTVIAGILLMILYKAKNVISLFYISFHEKNEDSLIVTFKKLLHILEIKNLNTYLKIQIFIITLLFLTYAVIKIKNSGKLKTALKMIIITILVNFLVSGSAYLISNELYKKLSIIKVVFFISSYILLLQIGVLGVSSIIYIFYEIYNKTKTHKILETKYLAKITLLVLGIIILLQFVTFGYFNEKIELQPLDPNFIYPSCIKEYKITNIHVKEIKEKICNEMYRFQDYVKRRPVLEEILLQQKINVKNKKEIEEYLSALRYYNYYRVYEPIRILQDGLRKIGNSMYFNKDGSQGIIYENLFEKCDKRNKITKYSYASNKSLNRVDDILRRDTAIILTAIEKIKHYQELINCYKRIQDEVYIVVETPDGEIHYKKLKEVNTLTEKVNNYTILNTEDIKYLEDLFNDLLKNYKTILGNYEAIYLKEFNKNPEEALRKEVVKENKPSIKELKINRSKGILKIEFLYPDTENVFATIYLDGQEFYRKCIKQNKNNNEFLWSCTIKNPKIHLNKTYKLEIETPQYSKTFLILGTT